MQSFRLVQESVSNALKHGNSKDIWVKIEWLHDIMNIIIKDNGQGFDQNEVKDKSFGFIGMRERIDLLKGEYDNHFNNRKWNDYLFSEFRSKVNIIDD